MGLGFLGCAPLVAFARGDVVGRPDLLDLARVRERHHPRQTRSRATDRPKAAEIGGAIVAVMLFRRPEACRAGVKFHGWFDTLARPIAPGRDREAIVRRPSRIGSLGRISASGAARASAYPKPTL